MGKPYQIELGKLEDTYRWAFSADVSGLAKAIKASSHLPLIAVGSGGSLSAAEIMASCHQFHFGNIARTSTPLELISALPSDGQVSVWFFSAGGGNVDIMRSFKHTVLLEPKQVAAMVGCTGSPLSALAARHRYVNLFEFELPSGRDGFLATNSLLAFAVLVCRAYDSISRVSHLPISLSALYNKTLPKKYNLKTIEAESTNLWRTPALHVLYSVELKPAAIDIESKFIEAGLGSVHLADLRNFAHGRHQWLSKHEQSTAVLALSSGSDTILAARTLDLIPSTIPRIHIPIKGSGSPAQVMGIILSLYLAGYAGMRNKIDPGRPGVPSFGRSIYNLRAGSNFLNYLTREDAAVRRKVNTRLDLLDVERKRKWRKSYRDFMKNISRARFGGLVLDYDGTVVDARNRYVPPTLEIVEQLVRLLKQRIVIGFATGRGKSIRKDLQKVIPKKYWDHVIVGYYNGAEISRLGDDTAPDGDSPPCEELRTIYQALQRNFEITSLAKITAKKYQITVEPEHAVPENFLWELANSEMISEIDPLGIVRSSHSIDILARGVSKKAVITAVVEKISEKDVLTIGDRGKWPGNDCSLLQHVYSLSVDEVSFAHKTCWNLCPAGVRGVQGSIYYLQRLVPVKIGSKGAVKFGKLGD